MNALRMLIHDSVWREEAASTRLVWVTLLALADDDGLVQAWASDISVLARVTLMEVERALSRLRDLGRVTALTEARDGTPQLWLEAES